MQTTIVVANTIHRATPLNMNTINEQTDISHDDDSQPGPDTSLSFISPSSSGTFSYEVFVVVEAAGV